MAYELRTKKGVKIKRDNKELLAADTLEIKIEQLDDKNKSFVAVGSTEHEDRDKDIVRQAGWKLANFKKNPVIPWGHDYYSPPVARSLKTWVDDNKEKGPRLLFMPKFDETDDKSMTIYNKYKNGFLTSFSVGFAGIEFNYRDEEDKWWGGREFTKQELFEISAVTVPANPHANTRLSFSGLDNAPDNMLTLGYPEMFAKTESGLFYPVADIVMFSQPKEFEVEEGVIGIKAVPFDDGIKIDDPIAYVFDPDKFDDKTANDWINQNVSPQFKSVYYSIKTDEEGSIELESFEEERDIQTFDESVDLIKDEELEEDVEDKDEDDTDDEDKDLDLSQKPELKQIVEVSYTLKDNEGNVIDQSKDLIGLIDETVTNIKEYKQKQIDTIIDEFKSRIYGDIAGAFDEMKAIIDFMKELKTTQEKLTEELKKTIEKSVELDNNSTGDDGSNTNLDDSTNNDTKDNDDEYELDDSFLASPDSNKDKNDSDDLIELDVDLTSDKSKLDTTVKDAVVTTLRNTIKNAFDNASGKID